MYVRLFANVPIQYKMLTNLYAVLRGHGLWDSDRIIKMGGCLRIFVIITETGIVLKNLV